MTCQFSTLGGLTESCLIRVLALFIVLLLAPAATAWATIRFELPELEIVSQAGVPTVGAFDVVVRADAADLAQAISSFNLHLSVESTMVQLGEAVSPGESPLLSGGSGLLNFSTHSQVVAAAHDVFPSSLPLVDQARLVRIPFEVAADVSGNFSLTFLSQNELVNADLAVLTLNTADTGQIAILPPQSAEPGNFDDDDNVDGNDFLFWQRVYPEIYDDHDLAAWRMLYGSS